MEKDFNTLLAEITKEVLRRAAAELPLTSLNDIFPPEKPDENTVVLVPSLVPFREKAMERLIGKFGRNLAFVSFGEPFRADGYRVIIAGNENREEIMELLESTINLVLLAPPLQVIRRIAAADDGDFLTWLFIRGRLWGKKTSIYLDFTPPLHRKAPYEERMVETLEALSALNVPLENYLEEVPEASAEERTLVTEEDVLEVSQAGKKEIAVSSGGIVTPLARDRAKELGISITGV